MDIVHSYNRAVMFNEAPQSGGTFFTPEFELVGGSLGLQGWNLCASADLTPGTGDALQNMQLQMSMDRNTWISAVTLSLLNASTLSSRAAIGAALLPFLRFQYEETGTGTWTRLMVAIVGAGVRLRQLP